LVRAAIEIVNRSDWYAAAELCDPVSLSAFRRQMLQQFEPTAPRFEITVEQHLRHSPEMPRAVAEFYVEQHRARMDPATRLRYELPGIPDVDALRLMSAEEIFAAWLDGRSPRRQIERLVSEGQISPASATRSHELASMVHPYVAIGIVQDGDDVAHVLYRYDVDAVHSSADAEEWLAKLPKDEQTLALELSGRLHPQVTTCRRQQDGTWRLLAGYDFLGLGSTAIGIEENDEEQSGDNAG
jgi:hypothetical protein